MSNAEFTLGAHLFLGAVDNNLPQLLNRGDAFTSAEKLKELGEAFRAAANVMRDEGVIYTNADKEWKINEEKLAGISDEKNAAFVPLYNTLIEAHEPVSGTLIDSGLGEYVTDVQLNYSPLEIEIEETTQMVISDDGMAEIAGASLAFIEAVQNDPANSAFLKGLSQDQITDLHASLADANYLMPEDAPEGRKTPISEQALRGTVDQQQAIYNNAAVIAMNLDISAGVQQGDKPAMAGAVLKTAVTNADVVEVAIEDNTEVNFAPKEYDLMAEDRRTIHNVFAQGSNMVLSSTYDNAGTGDAMVKLSDLVAVRQSLVDYRDDNVHAVLGRKDFNDELITRKDAKDIRQTIGALVEIVNYRPKDENEVVSADEGATSTESGYEDDGLDTDGSSGSRAAITDRKASDLSVQIQLVEDEKTAEREEFSRQLEARVDADVPLEEPMIIIPTEVMTKFESLMTDLHYKRTYDLISAETAELMGATNQPKYATLGDATRGGNKRSEVELITDDVAMSRRRYEEIGGRGEPFLIDADEGFLKGTGYKSPDPTVANDYIRNFVNEQMMGDDKVKFKAVLRSAEKKFAVADNEKEGAVWMKVAGELLDRDHEEKRTRDAVMQNKIGKSFADFGQEDTIKFVGIVEASRSGEPARIGQDKEGRLTISHPDGPTITSTSAPLSEELQKAGKSDRQFGGRIDVSRLRAGLENGKDEKGITVVMVGESPMGVMSKIDEKHTKVKEVVADRKHPDMALT